MQIARVGIQGFSLLFQRRDNMWMAVADIGDIVIGIEVAPAVGVEQPHAVAAYQMKRASVEKRGRGAEQAMASFKEGVLRYDSNPTTEMAGGYLIFPARAFTPFLGYEFYRTPTGIGRVEQYAE